MPVFATEQSLPNVDAGRTYPGQFNFSPRTWIFLTGSKRHRSWQGIKDTTDSFNRFSGVENTEVDMTAYQSLIKYLLQYNKKDRKLLELPANRPKFMAPVCYHSNLEAKPEFHLDEDKTFFHWPPICTVQWMMDGVLELHQHGLPPEHCPILQDWSPTPVPNPWDKSFEERGSLTV